MRRDIQSDGPSSRRTTIHEKTAGPGSGGNERGLKEIRRALRGVLPGAFHTPRCLGHLGQSFRTAGLPDEKPRATATGCKEDCRFCERDAPQNSPFTMRVNQGRLPMRGKPCVRRRPHVDEPTVACRRTLHCPAAREGTSHSQKHHRVDSRAVAMSAQAFSLQRLTTIGWGYVAGLRTTRKTPERLFSDQRPRRSAAGTDQFHRFRRSGLRGNLAYTESRSTPTFIGPATIVFPKPTAKPTAAHLMHHDGC